MKLFFYLLIFLIGIKSCFAQERRDTLRRSDSFVKKPVIQKPIASKPVGAANVKPDTVIKARILKPDTIKKPASLKPDTAIKSISDILKPKGAGLSGKKPEQYKFSLNQHPYFNFSGSPLYEMAIKRSHAGKDGLFYLMTGLVFYFALVKLLFSKYMNNLFAVFFRVSLKQKQIREQLLQSPLPSLLLNIFFIISGGVYVSFLLRYYNFVSATNLWLLIIYGILALGLVYLGKFLILKVLGWMFNISEATNTYIFVIFLVNKLLGILLIPFLILLAFSSPGIITILVTMSFTMVAIFFAYRYIISYAPVRKEIKVSQFHFFLYLCAFEIIPLLLIYKVLLTFLEKNS